MYGLNSCRLVGNLLLCKYFSRVKSAWRKDYVLPLMDCVYGTSCVCSVDSFNYQRRLFSYDEFFR